MKEVKGQNGEIEPQTPEYVPAGRIRLTSTRPDPMADALRRIAVLEEQMASVQMALPRGIPKP